MDAVTAPALEARELYRFFHSAEDETLALRGVSLRVEPGEMIAIVGASGSGKSTLIQCLSGLDEPDGGMVTVAGERLSHRSEVVRAEMRAKRIGVMLQSGNLLQHFSVYQNVLIAMGLAGSERRSHARELLQLLGISHRIDALPSQLSGGELARAALAVAMINDPAVLLANEPTGELDRESEHQVLALLRARAAAGAAVVVVTHNPTLAATAERVLHMVDGKLLDA
jgi:putative ABC transport system ATP-binding protein